MKKRHIISAIAGLLLMGVTATAETGEGNGSLTLFLSEAQMSCYAEGIAEFQASYPDVELIIDSYGMNDLAASAQKAKTQLMGGEGPDLLLMNSYGMDDVYKMLAAGVFAPLDEFMTSEYGWDSGLYVESVIEGGRFSGTQYVIPLNYSVQMALSSQEALDEIGLDVSACTDTLSLMQEVSALYGKEHDERILSGLAGFMCFPQLLEGDFLDYEEGKIGVDSQALKEACEAYCSMYEEDASDSMGDLGYYGYGSDILERKAYIHVPAGIDSFCMAVASIAAKETPVILPFGSSAGSSTAIVRQYAGIRANSQNKENAWNMLCILVKDEMQAAAAAANTAVPVSIKAVDGCVESKLNEAVDYGSSLTAVVKPEETFIQEYKNYLLAPEKAIFVNELCTSEFYTVMQPFYIGKSGYEECISRFEDYIKIYLSE